MSQKQDTGLTTIETDTGELATTGEAARAIEETRAALVMAKKFPRDEAVAFSRLMLAAKRPSFAEDATYSFPRGKKENGEPNIVSGPSINIAREAKRVWGNIRSGLRIMRDDATSRLIRAECWDCETGAFEFAEDDFKKLIQRRVDGKTIWVTPDERDLRELTNRRGAILERNVILAMLPKDLIEDAIHICAETLKNKAAEDPEGTRKRLTVNFLSFHITAEMIAEKLGHSLKDASPEELAELQAVFTSIKDGNSTWREYVSKEEATEKATETKAAESQGSKGSAVREKIATPPSGEKAPDKPAEKPTEEKEAKKPDPTLSLDGVTGNFIARVKAAKSSDECRDIMKEAEAYKGEHGSLSMMQLDLIENEIHERKKVLKTTAKS